MIRSLREHITGAVTISLFTINTIICSSFLFPLTFVKLVIRVRPVVNFINRILNWLARTWITINNVILALTRKIDWQLTLPEGLSRNEWYLVISNHQTWTDILVLQKILNRQVPFLKFFLKKELIWVPIMGPAWWALDFPFMKRYSKSFLEKYPHLQGKDIEITKKACAKFREIPVSVMNFVEGTRFTPEKHRRQNSPFRNLLRPKSGGIGFVFSTMGEYLTGILNVTIAYPNGPYTFWEFLCGKVREIIVDVEILPITEKQTGDYINDPVFREEFQGWLNGVWEEKDQKIDMMLSRDIEAPGPGARLRSSGKVMETKSIH